MGELYSFCRPGYDVEADDEIAVCDFFRKAAHTPARWTFKRQILDAYHELMKSVLPFQRSNLKNNLARLPEIRDSRVFGTVIVLHKSLLIGSYLCYVAAYFGYAQYKIFTRSEGFRELWKVIYEASEIHRKKKGFLENRDTCLSRKYKGVSETFLLLLRCKLGYEEEEHLHNVSLAKHLVARAVDNRHAIGARWKRLATLSKISRRTKLAKMFYVIECFKHNNDRNRKIKKAMVNVKRARLNNLARKFLRALKKKADHKRTLVARHRERKTSAVARQILKTWTQLVLIRKAWEKWQRKQDYENSIAMYRAFVSWKKSTRAALRWRRAIEAMRTRGRERKKNGVVRRWKILVAAFVFCARLRKSAETRLREDQKDFYEKVLRDSNLNPSSKPYIS